MPEGKDPKFIDNLSNLIDVSKTKESEFIDDLSKIKPTEKVEQNQSEIFSSDIKNVDEKIDNVFREKSLRKTVAENQTTGEQLGRQAAKTIPSIGLGILETAGYLLEIPDAAFSDKKDFSNSLIEFAKKGRNQLDEESEVLRENENEVFDLTDNAWWIQNIGGLVESIGEFGITGFGVGSILSNRAKRFAKGIIKESIKQKTAQTLTAATLAYAEGAMSGNEIYKQVYDNELRKGVSVEKAIELASDAASKTVKLNTLINTGLNMSGIAPLFNKNIKGSVFKKSINESLDQYRNRILKELDNPEISKFLSPKNILFESLQEGLEEQVNVFAEGEGKLEGRILSERLKGETWAERFLKSSTSDEGLLSAMLGAIGGSGQTVLTGIAKNKSIREQNQLNNNLRSQKINNIIKSLDDLDIIKKELQSSVENNDVKKEKILKDKLFNKSIFYNIANDSEESLIGTLQEVSKVDNETDLSEQFDSQIDELNSQKLQLLNDSDTLLEQGFDNTSEEQQNIINQLDEIDSSLEELTIKSKELEGVTEAMVQGLTKSKEDNSYKTIASNKISEISRLKNKYNLLKEKHSDYIESTGIDIASKILQNEINISDINQQNSINLKEKEELISNLDKIVENLPLREDKENNLSRKSDFLNKTRRDSLKKILKELDKNKSESEKLFNFNTINEKEIKEIKNSSKRFINNEISKLNKEIKENISKTDLRDIPKSLRDDITSNIEDEIRLNSLKNYNESKLSEYNTEEGLDKLKKEYIKEIQPSLNKIEEIQAKKINESRLSEKENNLRDSQEENKKEFIDNLSNVQEKPETELQDISDIIPDQNIPTDPSLLEEEGLLDDSFNVKEEDVPDIDLENAQDISDVLPPIYKKPIEEETEELNSYSENKSFSEKPSKELENDKNLKNERKIKDAAFSFANLVKSFSNIDGSKKTNSNKLNEDYPVVLMTGNIKEGDDVTLELDKDFSVITKEGLNLTYDNLLREEKRTDKENLLVPIKIVWKGENIGYLHDINWIKESNVLSEDNNIEYQKELLKNLRNSVINNNGLLNTKIQTITGDNILSINKNKNTEGSILRDVSKVFDNKDIRIGVIKSNGVFIGNTKIETDNSDEFIQSSIGKTVLLLPSNITGNIKAVPVSRKKLNSEKINSIIKILELYLSNNLNEEQLELSKNLLENTETDIRDSKEVKELLNNYIFSYSLSPERKALILNNKDTKDKSEKRYFNITETGVDFQKSGFSSRFFKKGEGLSNKQKSELKKHLEGIYINVDSNLINSNIKEFNITENNELKIKDRSYESFIKDNTLTDIHENKFQYKNKTFYSYFDNPIYILNNTEESKNIIKKENSKTNIQVTESKLDNVAKRFKSRRIREELENISSNQNEKDFSPVIKNEDENLSELKEKIVNIKNLSPLQVNDIVNSFYQEIVYSSLDGESLKDSLNEINLIIEEGVKDNIEIYKNIKENKEEIFKLLNTKLSIFDVNIDEDIIINEDFESLEEQIHFNYDSSFNTDSRFKASKTLRKFFSTITNHRRIEKENGEFHFSAIRDSLGSDSLVPVDVVFNKLRELLANKGNKFEDFISILEKEKNQIPWLEDVIQKIKNHNSWGYTDIERFKNQFTSLMSNSLIDFKTYMYGKGDKVINTNRNSNFRLTIENFIENFKNSNLVELDRDSQELKLKEKEINKVISWYEKNIINNKNLNPDKNTINEFLDFFNIQLSQPVLEFLENGIFDIKGQDIEIVLKSQFQNTKSGIFGLMYSRLKGEGNTKSQDSFEKNNPFFNNSGITRLAILESKYNNSIHSASFKNSEGNNIYFINNNRVINTEIDKLKSNSEYAKNLQRVPFLKPSKFYKTWLDRFAEKDESFLTNFELNLVESIKNENSSLKGIPLNNQTERQIEATQLIGYENQGSNYSYFIHKVPSKNTTFSFKAPKENIKILEKENKVFLSNSSVEKLYRVVESEINRMNTYSEILDSDENFQIEGYKPDKFYFFPSLNELEILNEDGTKSSLIQGGKVIVTDSIKSQIIEQLQKDFNSIFNDKKSKLERLEIIKDNKSLAFIPSGVNINKYISNYIVNELLANFNIHQLITDDPALFGKKDISSTWDNFYKRLTKDQAPGEDISYNKNNQSYIQLAIKDLELDSANIENIPEEFKESYSGIELTDAQEYTSEKEHLDNLYQTGKLSTEDYNKSLKGIYSKGVFQPQKPVSVNKRIVETDKGSVITRVSDYVKSSSIPLSKRNTENLELDKIRSLIENLENDKNLNPDGLNVRVSFKTANKTGGGTPLNIFNEDGTIKDNIEITKDNFVVQQRDNQRIQQEVPYDSKKDKSIDGTQQRKIITSAILDKDFFDSSGNKISGKQIEDKYNEVYKKIFEKSSKELEEELLTNEELDNNKLSKMLIKEARSRGWTENEIASLKLNNKGNFITPIYFNNGASRIESLINSLTNNKVLKQKRKGKSFVLVSENGWKGFGKNIIYTSSYDGELKPATKEGNLTQILVPSQIRDSKGNLVDLKKYSERDENGVLRLNEDKIPKSLLKGFGYRIPTQGYNSMTGFEIVGFLPDNMGDSIVLPRDVVAQMGSDYDVDKLFTFLTDIDYNSENDTFFKKLNDNNDLLDIELSIISNSEIYNLMLEPDTTGLLSELGTKREWKFPYLYDEFSNQKYLESLDGASGIGVFATLGTFLSLSKGKDIKFSEGIVSFRDIEGNNISDDKVITKNSRTKAKTKLQVNSYFLSASVDNEKDPILGKINANKDTFAAIQTLISSGFAEDHIVKFINQDVIKDYVSELNKLREKSQDEFIKDINIKVLENIISKIIPDNLNINNIINRDTGLLNISTQPSLSKINSKNYEEILSHLNKFLELTEKGRQISNVKTAINADSKFLPKSILESFEKENHINSLKNNEIIENSSRLLGNYVGDRNPTLIEPTTISGFSSFYGVVKHNNIFGDLFSIYNSNIYLKSTEIIQKIVEKNLSLDDKKDIFNNLKNAIYSISLDGFIGDIKSERKRLLTDEIDEKGSLANRVNRAKSVLKDNYFLQSLITEINPNKPHIIKYNNVSTSGFSDEYIQASFNELLFDNQTKKLGEDLIKYSLITDVNSGANNFVKFIHPEILEYYNINKQLYDFNKDDNYYIDIFIKQFIKNNPKYATRKETKGVNEFIDKNPTIIINGSEKTYTPFISSFNDKTFEYDLYSHDSNGKYIKINKLGLKRFIKEYDLQIGNKLFNSINESNNLNKNLNPVKENTSLDKKVEIDNKKINKTYLSNYNFSDFSPLVESIKNRVSTDSMKTILDLIKNSQINEPNVIIDKDLKSKGVYDSNKNEIRIKNNLSESDFILTFIEESIHSLTSNIINRSKSQNTEEQNKFIDQIEGIRFKLNETLKKENSEKFEKVSRKIKLLEDAKKNPELIEKYLENPLKKGEEFELFYPASSTKEFIANIFKSKLLQDKLNETNFTSNKNIFERFIDILSEFLNKFRTLKGETAKIGTDLRASLQNAISLIQSEKEKVEINKDINLDDNLPDIDLSPQFSEKEFINSLENEFGIRKKEGDRKRLSYKEAMSRNIKINKDINLPTGYKSKVIKIKGKGSRVFYSNEIFKVNEGFIDFSPEEDTKVKQFIKKLQQDIRILKNKITSGIDESEKVKLQARLEDISDKVSNLIENESLNVAIEIGNNELNKVEELLNQDKLNSTDLNLAYRTLSLWINSPSFLLEEEDKLDIESPIVQNINRLRAKADTLLNVNYLDILKDYIVKTAKDEFNVVLNKDELDSVQEDINIAKREFLSIAKTGNKIIDGKKTDVITPLIDKIIKDTSFLHEQETVSEAKKIDKVFTDFEKTQFFKSQTTSNKYDFLLQKDEKNQNTGFLVSELIPRYYKEKGKLKGKLNRQIYSENPNKEKITDAYNDYINFINENDIQVDVRKLFDKDLNFKENKSYIKTLENEFGKNKTKELIEDQINKIDIYKSLLEAEKLRIESTESELSNEVRLDIWESKNSPFQFLDFKEGKISKKKINGEFINSNGYNYISSSAKKEWIDDRFSKIRENKESLNFYNFIRDRFNSLYKIAPESLQQELSSTFIPQIPKTILEEVNENGFLNATTGIPERMLDLLREKNFQEISFSEQDRITGRREAEFRFPISRRKLKTKGEKEREISKQSFNIRDILKVSTNSVLAYKHKKTQEDNVRLLRTLLNYQKEIKRGNKTKSGGDFIIEKENALKNKKSQIDYAIESNFYNLDQESSFNPKTKKILSPDEKKTKKELEEQLILENSKEEPNINKINSINKKLSDLGSPITSKRFFQNIKSYIQTLGMGYNTISATTNMMQAFSANLIHASGSEDFSMEDFMKANSKMLQSTKTLIPSAVIGGTIGTVLAPGIGTILGTGLGVAFSPIKTKNKEASKIYALMNKQNVLGDIIERHKFKKDFNTGDKSIFEKLSPFEMQLKSEYFSQGSTMIALMLSEKLKTKDGKEITLYDSYNEKGEWKKELFNEKTNLEWNLKKFEQGEAIKLRDFRNKLKEVIINIHGNYDKDSKIKFKKNQLGQFLLQYRSWIPDGVANRWEDDYYDENLKRIRSGRWKQYKKNYNDIFKLALTFGKGKLNEQGLEPHEIANIRKNATELSFYMSLLAVGLFLKSLSDDDDDAYSFMSRFALNQVLRVQGDLTFYMNPMTTESISSGAIPAMSLMSSIDKTLEMSYRVLFDDKSTDKTVDAFWKRTIRFVPFGNQVVRTANIK